MQEETYFNEKQSISEKASIRDFTKKSCYGATSNSFGPAPTSKRLHKTEVLIRHDLSKNETLQGIALKYGCSVSLSLIYHKRCIESKLIANYLRFE